VIPQHSQKRKIYIRRGVTGLMQKKIVVVLILAIIILMLNTVGVSALLIYYSHCRCISSASDVRPTDFTMTIGSGETLDLNGWCDPICAAKSNTQFHYAYETCQLSGDRPPTLDSRSCNKVGSLCCGKALGTPCSYIAGSILGIRTVVGTCQPRWAAPAGETAWQEDKRMQECNCVETKTKKVGAVQGTNVLKNSVVDIYLAQGETLVSLGSSGSESALVADVIADSTTGTIYDLNYGYGDIFAAEGQQFYAQCGLENAPTFKMISEMYPYYQNNQHCDLTSLPLGRTYQLNLLQPTTRTEITYTLGLHDHVVYGLCAEGENCVLTLGELIPSSDSEITFGNPAPEFSTAGVLVAVLVVLAAGFYLVKKKKK